MSHSREGASLFSEEPVPPLPVPAPRPPEVGPPPDVLADPAPADPLAVIVRRVAGPGRAAPSPPGATDRTAPGEATGRRSGPGLDADPAEAGDPDPARVRGRGAAPPGEADLAWQAAAGFEVHPRPGWPVTAADVELQRAVVAYLLALDDRLGWALQLRLLARPGDGDEPPRLRLSLAATATAPLAVLARERLGAVAGAVALAGRFLAPRFELAPVADPADLEAGLAAFPLGDLVEVGRRRQELPAPLGPLAVPAPLPPRGLAGHWLCRALAEEAARLGRALGWVVTLEPAPTLGAARLHLADAVARLAEGGWPAGDPGAAADRVRVLERAREAGLAAPLALAHWHDLGGLGGRVQAFLTAAEGTVPAAVVAAAVAECGGDGAAGADGLSAPAEARPARRPRERALARRAVAETCCLDWEQRGTGAADGSAAPAGARSAAHLAGAGQASALFFLPVPGPGGIPGLSAARAPREVWRERPAAAPPAAPADAAPGGPALVLGDNAAGRRRQPVAISADDRRRHLYVVGQTGTGKSTLLLNAIVQDLEAGRGVGVIDPHGELVADVLARVPADRLDDVICLSPADAERPIGFNYIECAEEERDQTVESFIGLLSQLFDPHRQGIVGPRFEHAARNGMLTAMAGEGMTLVEVVRVLTDPAFVRTLLPRVADPLVRRYWTDQIARTNDFHRSEVLDYVVSKFSPFVNNRLLRNIVGQGRSAFSLRTVMDEGKILLVDLAQGLLGPKLAAFLGSIIVPKVLLAAFSRVGVPAEERRDFALYVDEFQHYATPAFVDVVSGARKYGLTLTMAHQHVGQLPGDVREAIFGNVGTQVALRAGVHDAALLAAAMQPSAFHPSDFLELPNHRAIARVLTGGRYDPCFTLATRPKPPGRGPAWAAEARRRSRERYGRPREEVEREIAERAQL